MTQIVPLSGKFYDACVMRAVHKSATMACHLDIKRQQDLIRFVRLRWRQLNFMRLRRNRSQQYIMKCQNAPSDSDYRDRDVDCSTSASAMAAVLGSSGNLARHLVTFLLNWSQYHGPSMNKGERRRLRITSSSIYSGSLMGIRAASPHARDRRR